MSLIRDRTQELAQFTKVRVVILALEALGQQMVQSVHLYKLLGLPKRRVVPLSIKNSGNLLPQVYIPKTKIEVKDIFTYTEVVIQSFALYLPPLEFQILLIMTNAHILLLELLDVGLLKKKFNRTFISPVDPRQLV